MPGRIAPCWRSSAGWIPARVGKYFVDGTQASSSNAHFVIKNTVDEASVSTATPDQCAVLRCGETNASSFLQDVVGHQLAGCKAFDVQLEDGGPSKLDDVP